MWEDVTTQQRPFKYELTALSTKYRTHIERARHSGFHALDVEHRTDSRRPLDRPPGTTTETDEDKDRLTLGTSEVAAPLQLTTHQNDEDGTYYFSHATR